MNIYKKIKKTYTKTLIKRFKQDIKNRQLNLDSFILFLYAIKDHEIFTAQINDEKAVAHVIAIADVIDSYMLYKKYITEHANREPIKQVDEEKYQKEKKTLLEFFCTKLVTELETWQSD